MYLGLKFILFTVTFVAKQLIISIIVINLLIEAWILFKPTFQNIVMVDNEEVW